MPAEASVIHVADFIIHGLGIGSSGASLVPELDPRAWKKLGLREADLPDIVRQAERQASDVMTAFFPEDG